MSQRPHVVIGTTAPAATTIASYASDGAFEAAKGSAGTDGDRYYNTTLEKYRFNENGTWKTLVTDYPQINGLIQNLGLSASVGSSALTVAVKTAAGADASATTPIVVQMRDATLTTGTPVFRTITGALSMTVSSGSTLGHVSAQAEWIYVYLIDNAGTLELAVSSSAHHDILGVVTTTAEGGAGAADNRYTMYSTSARSNVPCRLIGRLSSTQATAGTWATAISTIAVLAPAARTSQRSEIHVHTANGHGSTNNKIRRFTTTAKSTGSAITYADSAANGGSFTINEPGIYSAKYEDDWNAASFMGITINSAELTTGIDATVIGSILSIVTTGGSNASTCASCVFEAMPGDVVRAHTAGGTTGGTVRANFRIVKISD